MKHKKAVLITISFFASCAVAYGIGQGIVVPMTEKNEAKTEGTVNTENSEGNVNNNETTVNDGSVLFRFVDAFDTLTFEGKETVSTSDIPWGSTIAKIEEETLGTSIMMTPNTYMTASYHVSGKETLQWKYAIHPWVRANSDGLTMHVRVYTTDMENAELSEDYTVDASADYQSMQLSLEQFEGQDVKITFSVGNGANNDSNGDWLVLNELQITNITDNVTAPLEEPVTQDETYVKSAHYFSDEWPINFWNSEMDDAEKELAQIKADGFDSIILVVPWREFQPLTEPIEYNEYALQKLTKLMELADDAELDVILRVGYTWDYYQDENDVITDRFYQMTGNNTVSEAWYSYVKKIYDTVSGYSNFKGAFLTWEDFWNNLNVCNAELSEEESVQIATFMGYQKFVQEHYTLESYNENYGTMYESFNDIKIPSLTAPDMKAFYEYYDDFLNQILLNSQKVFPNLSMEVRIDADVIYNISGEAMYYWHDSTYACGDSDMTTVMYGIPMGFENNGERVTANEAMEKTDYILSKLLQENGQKKIYVDQFIYADNTPKFKNNAQVKTDELDDYLTNVCDILKRYTWGYGVWTYRNYCSNMFYNAQFALNTDGWIVSGDASVDEVKDSNMLKLDADSTLAQTIPLVRNHFPADKYILEFDIDIETDGECPITIQVGNDKQEVTISESGNYSFEFVPGDSFDFSLTSKEDCILDNMKLYSQVQEGFLYDAQGAELEQIHSVRILNEKLK